MTPECVTSIKKKIDAILKMQPPTTATEARSFIGTVNFYKSLWPRCAHVLAPLTELTSKRPFEWSFTKQRTFDEMKASIASNYYNQYVDLNEPIEIYTDASDYQLGAAIIQNGQPIAYYSKNLYGAQKN